MNKQIVAIIIGIALISLVSAIYPGECESIKFLNQDKVNFILILNTSSMEGFNWSKEGYDITYCFPTYLAPGNYSFGWSDCKNVTIEPVIVHHYSSGGSSTKYKTKYVDRNITEYIERDDTIGDDTIYISPDDEVDAEGLCSEETSIVTYISIGLLILCLLFFLIFNIISIKKRKAKEELSEQETPEEVQGE